MAFLNDLSRFAGNLTGGLIGESDEERKRKEELKRQARLQAAATVARPTPLKPTQAKPSTITRVGQAQQRQVGPVKQAKSANISTIATPSLSYRQRDDKGFDFYDGDRKIFKDEYLRRTGENDDALTMKLAEAGDVVSAREILKRKQPQMFNRELNDRLARARKVVQGHEIAEKQRQIDQEEATKTQQREQVKGLMDQNIRLERSGKGLRDQVAEYSRLDAYGQQALRDQLTKEATTEITKGDPKLERRRAEAALTLAALEEHGDNKFDLGQKTVQFGKDVAGGMVDMVSNLKDSARQMTALGGDGKTAIQDLEADLQAGRISRDEFIERVNEANNRLQAFAGSEDKGALDRALRAAAIATDAATTFVPVGSAVRGAKAGAGVLGQGVKNGSQTILDRAIREAKLNAGLSVPGAFSEGVDTQFGDVMTAAGMGAVMGGVPAVVGSAAGMGYRAVKDRMTRETQAVVEAELGRPLTPEETTEIEAAVDTQLQPAVESGQLSVEDEAILSRAPQEWPDEYAGRDPREETPATPLDNRAARNNLFDTTDARERFGQPRDLGESANPETQAALVQEELNKRIASLPDDNYVSQMSERFGLNPDVVRRLLGQTSKADLFKKLNDAADFVRTANSPDAAATSIMNRATEAGRAAAARAGVNLDAPAPKVDERNLAMDASGRYYDKANGEYMPDDFRPDYQPAGQVGTDTDVATKPGVQDESTSRSASTEPITTAQIVDMTNTLPESSKATGADIESIRGTFDATGTHLDNFATATTPEQRATLMKEIAEHERTGAELSPESRALYDNWVGPVVDSLYDKSRRAGEMGRKSYYLPEEVAGTEAAAPKKYGNLWADEANMEFGHAKRREGKIDTEELNDPASALKNYVQQFYQDNYGHLTPENIAEAEGRGAVDGAAYVTGRRNVAQKLDESMVRSLTDKKAGKKNAERVQATLAIAKDIRDNADATLDPESITQLRGGISSVSALRTNRKVAARIEAGNGQSVYERFGMRQFENAEALANDAFDQNYTDGISREEYGTNLHAYYDGLYQREFTDVMSPDRFHEIIEEGARRSYNAESAGPLAYIEQNLAMEKAIYATEHIRYSDKATQKYVDYEVGHILRRGKMPATLGRTIANNVSRTFYSGALGLNPLSAIQNFTEFSRVAGLTESADTAKTIKEQVLNASPKQINLTLKQYGVDSNRIRQEQADALTTEQAALRAAGKFRDVTEDVVMAGFNATETLKNYAMLKTLEVKHRDITDPRQRREAIMDDFNANSLIGGHYGNLLGVDRSNLMRVAMQFGTYTLRDWGQIADRAKAGDVAYVARVMGVKAALAVPMYALFGTSLAYTLGINEFKGGPAVGLTTELINSIVEENNRVENELEEGRKAEFDWGNVTGQFSRKAAPLMTPGGNYLFNKLGVQELVSDDVKANMKKATGTSDVNLLRDDTYIGDQQRGYNENKQGVPRFEAASDPMSQLRGILGGAYNTDEAREYFGKDFWAKPQLFGLFDTNTMKHSPAYGRFQEKIEGQSKILMDKNASREQKDTARATIRNTFDKAYESQDLRNEFFEKNPEAAAIYKEMTKTTFNKETGKRETDVISPEKWDYVRSEKSGKLFEYLKKRAELNHKNFGDAIDPIYQDELPNGLKMSDEIRRTILQERSMNTGDDMVQREYLYQTDWYGQFKDAESDYYGKFEDKAEDSDFGSSKRRKEWLELSKQTFDPKDGVVKNFPVVQQMNAINQQYGFGSAESNAFYEANKAAYFDQKQKYELSRMELVNKMRVLEGVKPLTVEQFMAKIDFPEKDASGAYTGGKFGKKYGSGSGSGSKGSTRTGANDTITRFGSDASGPRKVKTTTPDLIDVTKVVKQPRAMKKAPIRITI